MFRTKVTNLAILAYFLMAKMATNGHFGHLVQSEVSENGPIGFLMSQNLGIDIKIKFLGLAILAYFEWLQWPQMAVLATQVNQRCLKIIY